MFLFHRKALAAAGCTAAAIASTALFATPAQAASAGLAKVVGSSAVQFNALLGKGNGLTITISGRTVTLDDRVALKAGKGCKAVKGDKTKVKCTTAKKTSRLSIALGDKNDWVTNKTSVYMLADAGSGTDTLTGGSGNDQLQGGTGNDKLYGKACIDTLFGGSGDDHLGGSTGNDYLEAGPGADKAYGEAGNDEILGGSGKDRLVGGVGNDEIAGGSEADSLAGDAGTDTVVGEAGDDTIAGGAGDDVLVGEAGNDRIMGAAGHDVLLGGAGTDRLLGEAGEDLIHGDAGNDGLTGGAGDDLLYGKAGNDAVAGDAGDDILIGEDFSGGQQTGSNSALDRLHGGTNATVEGDFCLVMAAGTTAACEEVASSALARTAAAADRIDAAQQRLGRATAARAAVK